MSKLPPIWTGEEIASFVLDLHSKFRAGMRNISSIFYTIFTLVGVAWASFAIPSINKSEINPETIGIYVIGVLITVTLDAILYFIDKRDGASSPNNERNIAGLACCLSFLLIIAASILSTAVQPEPLTSGAAASTIVATSNGAAHANISNHAETTKHWRDHAEIFLFLILIISIIISLVLAGIDTDPLKVGSVSRSIDSIADKP